MKKVLVAMSGGVDSSVAAYLMKKEGYECIGITMRLFDDSDVNLSGENSCCTDDNVRDAENVAHRLGIDFDTVCFTDSFKSQVIDRFISAYEAGATPNPCVDCNRYIKFKCLYDKAKKLGCDYIVTGHYARIDCVDGKFRLKKAVDKTKDQSYVLYSLTQEQLSHTKFPIGEFDKSYAREIAEQQNFINANKKDSQDICFVPDGDYAKVIEHYSGKVYAPGDFVDMQGNVLGQHKGIIRYTIGQRKGLGLALPQPMYVCEKRISDNKVVLGLNEDLMSYELDVKEFNWISGEVPKSDIRIKAKIRYNQEEQWAMATPVGENSAHIVFDQPQRAIASGQSAVLYDGDVVVGGGIIV